MEQLTIGDIVVDVVQKDIKNLHLSVYPPVGKVKIAAPLRMDLDTIRVFAISKLRWIKKQQHKFLEQQREAPREFKNRESHYFLGKRYLLKIVESQSRTAVIKKHNTIELHVAPGSDTEKYKVLLDEWYRRQLKLLVPDFIKKWEPIMNVQVAEFGIKKMKTKWGTCKPEASRIWLNLELAKKPLDCIEYIVVHEMVHLLERSHNDQFIALMNRFMPKWRMHKDLLNSLPLRHTDWGY